MTRFEVWFLTALMVALWALMPATQLWDWDEAHYARTGIEMYESGNLILPQFNGELYGHKPPLGFWIMGFAAKALGETEFAVRFFSSPAMAIAVFLTGRSGAILFNADVGRWSMVVFATSFLSLYLGAAAMLDSYLMAGISLSVWAFLQIFVGGRDGPWVWAGFLLGGLITLLAKGPVGPVMIGGLVLGSFLFIPRERRPSWVVFWKFVGAGFLAIVGFLFWFFPANASSGGDLSGQVIGVHIIGRALAPMEGHGGQGILGFFLFLPIYVPVLFLGLLPWSAYLPGALGNLFAAVTRENRVILLSWAVPLFLAFSLAATKLPHYVFPVLAPVSIAIAVQITQAAHRPNIWSRGIAACLYLLLAVLVGAVAAIWMAEVSVWRVFLSALAFLCLAFVIWQSKASPAQFAMASFASILILYWGALREAEPLLKVSRQLGEAIQTYVPEEAVLFMGGYREPSLAFYASRPVSNPMPPISAITLEPRLRKVPNGYAVLLDREKEDFEKSFPNRDMTVLARQQARNFNVDGHFQTVYLIGWTSK